MKQKTLTIGKQITSACDQHPTIKIYFKVSGETPQTRARPGVEYWLGKSRGPEGGKWVHLSPFWWPFPAMKSSGQGCCTLDFRAF